MSSQLQLFFIIGSAVMFFFYHLQNILSSYYFYGYEARLPKWLCCTLFPLLQTIIIFALLLTKQYIFIVLLVFGVLNTIEFLLAYRESLASIVFSSNIVNFVSMFTIQICISVTSIVVGSDISMRDIYMNPAYLYPILFFACPFGVLFHACCRRPQIRQLSLKMIDNEKTLHFLCACLLGFNVYMLLSCLPIFMSTDPELFPIYFTVSHIVLSCIFLFILDYGVKACFLNELTLRSNTFEKQLTRQLLHYKSYEKYTDSLRVFRHDYKQMMRTVNHFLDNGQIDEARRLIAQINDQMQNRLGVHKKYSNNYLVDAILQDTANLCFEKQIDFSAQVYLPDGIHCSDVNTCRITSNLVNNALEACENINSPDIRPFIRLESALRGDWLTVTVENSFDGKVRLGRDGLPVSTKKDTDNHGMGVRSVHELIEEVGGLMMIDADQKQHVFTVRLHLKKHAIPEPAGN